jgi:tetratricopeptide (TPR) repeat protein
VSTSTRIASPLCIHRKSRPEFCFELALGYPPEYGHPGRNSDRQHGILISRASSHCDDVMRPKDARWPLFLALLLSGNPAQAQSTPDSVNGWKRSYLLARAGALYAEGKTESAEKMFRSVLDRDPHDKTALMHLAAIANQRGDRKAAISHLEQAVLHHPKSFEARIELGNWLFATGNVNASVPHLRAAVRLSPGVATAWLALGDALMESGAPPEALDAYREAERREPNDAIIQRQLGYALFRSGLSSEALVYLTSASMALNKDEGLFLAMGHCHRVLGNHSNALAAYRKVLEMNPESSNAHLFLGMVWDQTNRDDAAQAAFGKAIALDPKNVNAHIHLGIHFQRVQNPAEARKSFEAALDIEPKNAWAMARLGLLFYSIGEYQKAALYLRQAIQLDPSNPALEVALGEVHGLTGDHPQAEVHFRKALKLDPKQLDAGVKLGDALLAQDKTELAQLQLLHVSAIHPKSAWALIRLGDAERALKKDEAAQGRYRAALHIDPDSSWAKRQLAFVLADVEKYDEAEVLLRSMETSEEDATAQMVLGHIEKHRGRLENALAHYRRAQKLNPNDGLAHLFIGEVTLKLGDPRTAEGHFDEALRLDSTLLAAWVLKGDALRNIATGLPKADATERLMLQSAARRAYEEGATLAPENPWPRRQLGLVVFEAGELEKAKTLLEGVLPNDPLDGEVLLTLGRIHQTSNHCGDAYPYFEKAMLRLPRDARPPAYAAACYRTEQRFEDAIGRINHAQSLAPNADWISQLRAYILYDLKKPGEATTEILRSSRLNPDAADTWQFLGRLAERDGQYAEAVSNYSRAMYLEPDKAETERALASAFFHRGHPGDLDRAVHFITNALHVLSEEVYTHVVASTVFSRKSKESIEMNPSDFGTYRDLARKHIDRAMKLESPTAETRLTIAYAQIDLHLLNDAVTTLVPLTENKASSCPEDEFSVSSREPDRNTSDVQDATPTDPEQVRIAQAHQLLGDIALETQNDETARHHFACALALDRKSIPAGLRLGYAYERSGMLYLAQSHYQGVQSKDPDNQVAYDGISRIQHHGGLAAGPFRVLAASSLESYPIPAEVNARLARSLNVNGTEARKDLGNIPKFFRNRAGILYGNERGGNVSVNAEYALVFGFDTYIGGRPGFDETVGHMVSTGLRGSAANLDPRIGELSYRAGYRFFLNDSQELGETRNMVVVGARLATPYLGTWDTDVSYERTGFRFDPSRFTFEDSADSLLLALAWTPKIALSGFETSLGYQGQGLWFQPTGRHEWRHAITARARQRLGRWFVGGDLRVAYTNEILDPNAPEAFDIFSTGIGTEGGVALGGTSELSAMTRIENAWGESDFDAGWLGAGAKHRFPQLIPGWVGTEVYLSAQVAMRYRYNLGAVDPVITVQLGLTP